MAKSRARKGDKGGRPKLIQGEKTVVIPAMSVPESMAERFYANAERFANGNRSEFFRVVYRYWECELDRLSGRMG